MGRVRASLGRSSPSAPVVLGGRRTGSPGSGRVARHATWSCSPGFTLLRLSCSRDGPGISHDDERKRAKTPPQSPPLSSGRRWLVRGLLIVATLIGISAVFAVWANRQVLDADNWADTSSNLLANPAIRTQVSAYLVDQVYTSVDVSGEFRAAFPPRLDPLAGPAANGLRQLAEKRPRSSSTGRASVDVGGRQPRHGPAVHRHRRGQLQGDRDQRQRGRAQRPPGPPGPGSAPGRVGQARRQDPAGRRADHDHELRPGEDPAERRNGSAGPVGCCPGWRWSCTRSRSTSRPAGGAGSWPTRGGGFISAGIVVLDWAQPGRTTSSTRWPRPPASGPAAEAAWSIGTQMLRDVAQAAIIIGIPVIAAWLAGPTRPPWRSARRGAVAARAARPGLRHARPGAPARRGLGTDPGDADGAPGPAHGRPGHGRPGGPAPPGRRGVPRTSPRATSGRRCAAARRARARGLGRPARRDGAGPTALRRPARTAARRRG